MTDNKNHLTVFDNLICKNPGYNKFLAEATCKGNSNDLFKKFAEGFFSYLPIDYVTKDQDEMFIGFAREAYNFFQNRTASAPKIEILKGENNSKPFLSLKLINDDKPFIIDSLKCLFAKLGIIPKFIFHPVLSAARDSNGALESIGESNATKESLVCVIFYLNKNDQFIAKLQEQVLNLLDKVSTIYKSWPDLLNKVDLVAKDMSGESYDFMQWIKDDHFTFLGYGEYNKNGVLVDSVGDDEICAAASLIYQDKKRGEDITLGQVSKLSPIHKNTFMDYVKVTSSGRTYVFVGLYGSAIYYQSVNEIPILRKKLQKLLKSSGFVMGGYNYKKLRAVTEALPREFLFNIEDDQLECISTHILSAMSTNSLKVFVNPGHSAEFVNILLLLPRERLTPDVHYNINQYFADKFKTNILTDYIKEIENNFSYLYITLAINDLDVSEINMQDIESDIDNISANWHDALTKAIHKKYDEYEAQTLISYVSLFPKNYQYQFSAIPAALDITYIARLSDEQLSLFNLNIVDSDYYQIKIYTKLKQNLSDLLPLIENIGFKAINEQMFELIGEENFWIYQFNVIPEHKSSDEAEYVKNNVEDAMAKMSSGLLPIDSICKLVMLAGFNWRQIIILKGLIGYLQQTGFAYDREYVKQTLIKHYSFAFDLLKLFEAKFNPAKFSQELEQKMHNNLEEYLALVKSSAEDKVLRSLLSLILAITRTNCYQHHKDGSIKNYISFKFDSSKVPGLPRPVPHAEIFVYSNEFEGVHLRGGKVARGGLRWSDRGEDYRTEVLGLMKAQMTKNAVIVPVGSKGGFFVRVTADSMERSVYMAKVVECYRNFLRGLLDLTDNVVEGKIVHPEHTIMLDDSDPYLVVAADKGTATFSDYANEVSAEYNFWLGDAFASGGSAGYDHKKMAITARGAWIAVANHFATLGKDVQKDPITVVGIGDMSGDVFGNGMLLSSSIKLVAAFNHMHIFLDPSPEPESSFKERKRLFDLPGSKWVDYDPKLISKGGGVFSRADKKIVLTTEIQALLGVELLEVEPDQLINLLLKAKVDLLWNGGIGTYIKASDESHLEIGDKANDNLRCNGRDVGAKVIGEGGNLGVSQRGRIEFSRNGGRINTDFIDNSAGVDCSDHEVNIKIALGQSISKGRLDLEVRNKLLTSMTDEVAHLVLEDNFKQTQAITITEKSNAYNLEMFGRFITHLESSSLLDRAVEYLPTEAEMSRRGAAKEGMTRPELSVLLSYGKTMVRNDLVTSKLADDDYFDSLLMSYFPSSMRDGFKEEILSHQLRREIILTMITNKMINQLGGPIVASIQSETGAMLCDIVRSYVIICSIFNLDDIWQRVEKESHKFSSDIQIEMFTELGKIMRRGISWFVRNLDHPIDIKDAIKYYTLPAQRLSVMIGKLLLGDAKLKRESRLEYYIEKNVEAGLAEEIVKLDSLISAFDIIFVANITKIEDSKIAELYFSVSDRFSIDWLRKACEKQANDSYWNKLSIQALKDDLYDKQRRLLQKVVTCPDSDMDLSKWHNNHIKYTLDFTTFIDDLRLQENIDLNMMILANKKFEMFLRKV
jgi:glutamate dehydrogenase